MQMRMVMLMGMMLMRKFVWPHKTCYDTFLLHLFSVSVFLRIKGDAMTMLHTICRSKATTHVLTFRSRIVTNGGMEVC